TENAVESASREHRRESHVPVVKRVQAPELDYESELLVRQPARTLTSYSAQGLLSNRRLTRAPRRDKRCAPRIPQQACPLPLGRIHQCTKASLSLVYAEQRVILHLQHCCAALGQRIGVSLRSRCSEIERHLALQL